MTSPRNALSDQALPISDGTLARVGVQASILEMSTVEGVAGAEVEVQRDAADLPISLNLEVATAHVRAAVMMTKNVPCDRGDS